MIKKYHITFLVGVIAITGMAQGQTIVKCGTMEALERLKQEHPELELRMQKIEDKIQEWIRAKYDTTRVDTTAGLPMRKSRDRTQQEALGWHLILWPKRWPILS